MPTTFHLGPYRIVHAVRRGAAALRVEAEDTRTGAPRVLHIVHAPDAERREATRAWADAIVRIDHPNLVVPVEVFEHGDVVVVVEEHLDGPSLATALAEGPFTPEQADHLGEGLLHGLGRLHAEGLVHGALTPDAIHLAVDGAGPVPMLRAPGLAAALGAQAPPPFRAPSAGAEPTRADDLYAAGALLLALFVGREPNGSNPSLLRERLPEVEARHAEAVTRALREDVDQRAQTATELLTVWEGSGEGMTGRLAPARAWDARSVERLRALTDPPLPDLDPLADLRLRPDAEPAPPALAVIRVDTAASYGVVALIVVWIALGIGVALGRVPASPGAWVAFTLEDPFPFLVTLLGTVGGLGVTLWRVRRIRWLLACGEAARATIDSADFFRGRGRIRLTYLYGGHAVTSWLAVRDLPSTRALTAGRRVDARVDPQRPDVATLPALFEADPDG